MAEPMDDAPETEAAPSGGRPRILVSADDARAALAALAERRREERSVLQELAQMVADLAEEIERWQASAIEAQNEATLLAGELARARDRLRKAEDLLATAHGIELPASDERTSPVDTDARSALGDAARPNVSSQFGLEEVRLAQRHFNESLHTEKMRSVRRSLGRPAVGLFKVAGHESKALLTVAWEIVWYQYLLELSATAPPETRATLFAEGMELGELADHFKQSNASLDDDGRLDASELEVSLLQNEEELLTHFSPEQEAALDDATEEIWDRHSKPEFRWDD